MIKVNYTFNVDTLIVTDTTVFLNIGDIVTVTADARDPEPEVKIPGLPSGPEPKNIGWSLAQVPTNGKPNGCFVVIGQNGMEGTMTFEAVGLGYAEVEYRVTNGPDAGVTKMTKFEVK